MSTKSNPEHIAIIMDGNGRWATTHGKNRTQGHLEGLKAAKRIIRKASELSIPYMTLYAFSTENWRRPETEVSFLMGLIGTYLRKEYPFYRELGIRITHSGDLSALSPEVSRHIVDAIAYTKEHTGTVVNLAINYGGRDEIVRAFQRLLNDPEHTCSDLITEESIAAHLDNPWLPDPDLVIRTAGECRLSNFLIWQSAYAELHFSDKLWPDWNAEDLVKAIEAYQHRDRRFGGLH